MNRDLLHIIDAFAGLNILVIGEAMLDSYLHGSTHCLCREAPVPVVTLSNRQDVPGGAANTAVNVRSLGGQVTFLSLIGNDFEGALLRHALEECDISTEHIRSHPLRRTLTKHRVIAAAQMLLRFDQGSTGPADPESEAWLIDHLSNLFKHHDAVIVSDYDYGILTPQVIAALASCQADTPRLLVVDAKHPTAYRYVGVTAVKPNFEEVVQLLGTYAPGGSRTDWITAHEQWILDATGAQIAAVTLDTEGALIFEQGHPPYRTYARPTTNAYATGAGDTFVSALTLALAVGADTPSAAELASAACAVAVAKEGTTACSADALRAYISTGDKYIADLARLAAYVGFYRQQGARIVFTNGCFDILHRGHINLLNQAKELGDILIVGVNSDRSVRRLKGPGRPVNTLKDRLDVLAALSCVDYLVAFDDAPDDLIRTIRPDLFVKGGNYRLEALPEAALVEALGGEIRILPYLHECSTTSIIERIRDGNDQATNGYLQNVRGELA